MQLISLFIVSVLLFTFISVVTGGLGLFLLSFFKNKFTFNALEKLTVAQVVGFSFLGSFLFILGQLIDIYSYYSLYLIMPIGIYFSFINRQIYTHAFTIFFRNRILGIFGLISALMMAMTLTFSWININDTLYIQNGQVHDSVWHIALIENLHRSIPPIHPSSYEQVLTHYHYFYDIIIAGFSKSLFIESTILYFQVYPLYLTLLLVSSIFIFCNTFKQKYITYFALLFTFYGGGFTYLLPLFLEGHNSQESSFWVSQTFSMMLNPQLIYSFSLLFVVLFLFKTYETMNAKSVTTINILIIFLSITSIGFKSYSFVILLVLYFTFNFFQFIKKPNKKSIFYSFLTILLSIPLYILVVGLSKESTFFYSPLWYVNSMIEAEDRLNFVKIKLVEDFYRADGQMHKVYFIKTLEIIVFYVGNLGSRIVFLLLPLVIFIKKYKFKEVWLSLILLVGFIATSVFPLLFLQTGTVWNSIQFWYYSLILVNILAAFTVNSLLATTKNRYIKIGIIITLIATTVIPFVQTMPNKIPVFEKMEPTTMVPLKELNPQDKVLICAKGWHLYTNSLVLAITKAQPYFADVGQLSLTGTNGILEKEAYINDLFDDITLERLQTFIEQNNITALVCKQDENEGKLRTLHKVKLILVNDD